jgi:serine/threonine protein kinase
MDHQHFRLPSIGDLVGDYRIVDLIGNGGQGHVYRAEASGRAYAVKFLDPGLDRFGTREVQALMRLTELRLPGVVRFIACGRWPDRERGLFYVVMEYVEGLTLYDYVMVHNPSARRVGELVLSLGRTLIAVQEAGVLHRDVKRENIMVRLPSEEPVVLDFGLAALRGASSGEGFSQVTGTLEYLSPEAWRHAGSEDERYRPTAKDEQWALGVTFYWLLTDRLPFGAREDPLMTRRVLRESPKPPHVLNPRVPPELGAVCMRLLEKNPEDRYADLRELCGELRRVLEASQGVESWEGPLGQPDAPECRTTEIDATLLGPDGIDPNFRNVRAPRRGRYVKLRPPAPVAALPGPMGGRQRAFAAFQVAARRAVSWTMMLALGLFGLMAPLAQGR